MRIICSRCRTAYPLNSPAWVCTRCGSILEIQDAPAFNPNKIVRDLSSLWRYRAMLPLPAHATPMSLGEGWTPLIAIPYAGRNIYGKFDFLNPTGSFKDRGATVMVSALQALGVSNVVEDSSGNAAAALAGYAAFAGLHATIFTPAHASPTKLAQIAAYGAQLEKIEGVREKSAGAAQAAVRDTGAYYASHYYNPFFMAGLQTTAWELWEQLEHRAPDVIIVPAGHGTNLVGIARGMAQLHAQGLIARMPRLIAAQSEKVAPLALAYERGANEPVVVEPANTIAEGIANSQPLHGAEVLRIIHATGGAAVAVSEDEIRAARLKLAHHGIFVEPTSATAIAVLDKLIDTIPREQTIVVSLTGNGLKAPLDL